MPVNVDAYGHLPRIEDEDKTKGQNTQSIKLQFSLRILKRLSRRMRMKSVRLIQLVRKSKIEKKGQNQIALTRAETWEYAAGLLDEEISAIHNAIKRL